MTRYVMVSRDEMSAITAACEMMTRRLVEAGASSPTTEDNALMGRMMATLRGIASRPPVGEEVVEQLATILENELAWRREPDRDDFLNAARAICATLEEG